MKGSIISLRVGDLGSFNKARSLVLNGLPLTAHDYDAGEPDQCGGAVINSIIFSEVQ